MLERFLFKKVENWILIMTIFVLLGTSILLAYIVQGTIRGYGSVGIIGDCAVKIAESPRLVRQAFSQLFGPNEFLVSLPEQLQGKINTFFQKGGSRHLGLISFFEPGEKDGQGEFFLKDIETGKLIEKWVQVPKAPIAISFFDNTLIIEGEPGVQDSTSSLSKIGKDGKVIWKTGINSHHLTYVDKTGKIYTPIIMSEPPAKVATLLKGSDKYRDDGYAILSPDGRILQKRSLTRILLDNNLGHLILGVGPLEWDAIHLNAVKPAEQSSDFWEKGDLLLSLRHLSMVMIYRPSNNKIIWYQMGPWLNQHDPDFMSSHQISLFGNDVVSSFYNRTAETAPFWGGGDNIYVYDFIKKETSEPFLNLTEKIKYKTVTAGRHTLFRDGSFFVWYSEKAIGVFFDRQRADFKYFGLVEGKYLNRRGGINAYTWETYKTQRNHS